MAFTFDSTLSTDRDWIRADLGDTDSAVALVSDEQIAAVLAAETTAGGNRQTATWCLAAQMVASIVREPVKLDAAGASYDYSQRLTALQPLAAQWRALEAERLAAADEPVRTARQPSASVKAQGTW